MYLYISIHTPISQVTGLAGFPESSPDLFNIYMDYCVYIYNSIGNALSLDPPIHTALSQVTGAPWLPHSGPDDRHIENRK